MTHDPKKQRGKDKGFHCRRCGCRQLPVLYTRPAIGEKVVRRRKCRKCGERLLTAERVIG